MTPSEIKPGMKFGNWTVIKFDHVNKHRIKYFLCKCEVCGTIKPVRGTALINGTSTACSKACSNSLVGQTFGYWEVLKVDPSRKRYYICKCKCGTIKSVYGPSLKNGTSKSCGCLKVEKTKEYFKERAESHIGETFGLLTVEDVELKNNDYYYKCKCECGNEALVLGKRLLNGITISCGCINSKANEIMAKTLTKLEIPFKREYKFENCKDKSALPFDFALFNHEGELIGLIENNGS